MNTSFPVGPIFATTTALPLVSARPLDEVLPLAGGAIFLSLSNSTQENAVLNIVDGEPIRLHLICPMGGQNVLARPDQLSHALKNAVEHVSASPIILCTVGITLKGFSVIRPHGGGGRGWKPSGPDGGKAPLN